jgi:phosphatidylglycerophosphate synthase
MLNTFLTELPAQLDQLPVAIRRKVDKTFERALELYAHSVQACDCLQQLYLCATDRVARLLLAFSVLRTGTWSFGFVLCDASLVLELRQQSRKLSDLRDDPAHTWKLVVRLLHRIRAQSLHGSKIASTRQTSLVVHMNLRLADGITGLRLLMLPVIWWWALLGNGRLVGVGLIAAGLTDAADGFVARRLGQASPAGARLDLIADTLLLLSAIAWIGLLHPNAVRANTSLVAAAFSVYIATVAIGVFKFRRLPNLHLYSSKAAGGLLYAFAVITLLAGGYQPLLLVLAAAAFMVSCAETVAGMLLLSTADASLGSVLLVRRRRVETSTVQAIGSASKQRSQAPTANVVGSNASPTRSRQLIAAPKPNDSGP